MISTIIVANSAVNYYRSAGTTAINSATSIWSTIITNSAITNSKGATIVLNSPAVSKIIVVASSITSDGTISDCGILIIKNPASEIRRIATYSAIFNC